MSNLLTNKMKLKKSLGIWTASVDHMNVELVVMATMLPVALRGLRESIDYIELGCWKSIVRGEVS